jgi:hypothetical protein
MLGFLFGVVVGAAGFWAYRFWKGGEDTSWDQSFSTSGSGSSSYGTSSSQPVGSGSAGTTADSGKPLAE